MLTSPPGVWLKRRFDSNDFAWTLPLPPWAPPRERQVRRIRIIARSVLRHRLVAERGWFYVFTSSCAWPGVAFLKAVVSWRASAQPDVLGVMGRWWLQLAHNLGIGEQQYFRLERPEQRPRARLFVTDGENKALMEYLNRDAHPERVRDKVPFAQFCAAHGLPTATVLAECAGEGASTRWHAPLPAADLFLKPGDLWGGKGACRIRYVTSDQTWRADDQTALTSDTIAAYAERRFHGLSWVLQPCLVNGPDWAKFSPGALCTVRVITGRENSATPPVVVGGFMRFPRRDAVVDNLSAGGWGTDYAAGGRLGPLRSLDAASPFIAAHPDTGAVISGTVIPKWDRVSALAIRAHAPLSDIAMIGWDVALPGDEPILIEANTNWGVPLDTPLGATRYVEILNQPQWRCC